MVDLRLFEGLESKGFDMKSVTSGGPTPEPQNHFAVTAKKSIAEESGVVKSQTAA